MLSRNIPRMAKILAVDDDEAILATIIDILVADGHAVTPAGNGLQASNLFRKERFDLIVADIVMPEKEGIETILELKREFPKIPVIAISGSSRFPEKYLEVARNLGADETLSKPFDVEQLRAAISAVTRHSRHLID